MPALAVEALGRVAVGDDLERVRGRAPGAVGLLERLGVVVGGRVDPAVEVLAGVIGAPLVRVAVKIGAPAPAVAEGRAWLGAGFGAYAWPGEDGLYELGPGLPSGAPVFVAGLVGLGPRPPSPVTGEVVVREEALRALRGGDRAAAGAAPDAVLAIADNLRSVWSAQARWMVGQDRVARRGLRVLDAGDAGLWEHRREGELARLRPVRSREVWRELCALLPAEAELLASVPGGR